MSALPEGWTLPVLTPFNRDWFTTGEIAIQECEACATLQHPPEEICHACGSMTPLRVRKMAAANGLANRVRSECSKMRPNRPTGMVAITSSHAMRSWLVSIRRRRIERTKPLVMATQSRQKKATRAMAVATCRPTRKAR